MSRMSEKNMVQMYLTSELLIAHKIALLDPRMHGFPYNIHVPHHSKGMDTNMNEQKIAWCLIVCD